jgi:hypothetical protein
MSDQEYVTNDAWLRQAGRPDLVDEVADQFERPVAVGMQSFWSAQPPARWPRGSRGWRSAGRLHPRALERRAG